jgi:cobyrinic acid a,c-diamide synthase
MIAGTHSGSGKSTITMGILLEMKRLGLDPTSFKAGPDFLDPMHHSMALGKACRNLDTWMFPEGVEEAFARGAAGSGISVVEGVMGLYDGVNGRSEEGSSAHLAKILGAPVVLVVDASGAARSAGAVAEGFRVYDPGVNIAGVIFNNVGGPRHLKMLEESLRGIPCFGGVLRNSAMHVESRHLGLVPAEETHSPERYEAIRAHVSECVDVKGIAAAAAKAPPLDLGDPRPAPPENGVRIGVARDRAFNFYYIHNIEDLERAGATIVYFSPENDPMPDVDGLYFGGGYPELFAAGLEKNSAMRMAVKKASDDGMPVYAECGGMMYLCSRTEDAAGRSYSMAGVFDARTEIRGGGRMTLGYVEAKSVRDTPISAEGWTARGHEFHYSSAVPPENSEYAWELSRGKGIADGKDGLFAGNTVASYLHLHFAANPKIPARFAECCRVYSRR